MLFKNIEISNCKELLFNEETGGYKMCRIPLSLNDKITGNGFANSGVELRFVLIDDEIRITLQKPAKGTATRAIIYYGSVQSGWENLYKNIYDYPTEIVIPKPKNPEFLEAVSKEHNLPFAPEVVRVVLANGDCEIIDVKGKCRPPEENELPEKTYLAYGSSITHGSLAMVQPNTYVARVAEHFNADALNLGFAGNAKLEPEVADYIAKECKFDFATIEMGINILDIEPDDFRNRVRYFVKTIAQAHPDKKIFCIDVFFFGQDMETEDREGCRPREFRKIVKEVLIELNLPNTIYVNGLSILTNSYGLSQDSVHPNARGVEEMSRNLISVIEKHVM